MSLISLREILLKVPSTGKLAIIQTINRKKQLQVIPKRNIQEEVVMWKIAKCCSQLSNVFQRILHKIQKQVISVRHSVHKRVPM